MHIFLLLPFEKETVLCVNCPVIYSQIPQVAHVPPLKWSFLNHQQQLLTQVTTQLPPWNIFFIWFPGHGAFLASLPFKCPLLLFPLSWFLFTFLAYKCGRVPGLSVWTSEVAIYRLITPIFMFQAWTSLLNSNFISNYLLYLPLTCPTLASLT